MASESEYALMAGAVYISTRAKINQLSAPNGWEKVTIPQDSYVSDPDSGFEAIAFYNTANPNKIVIAYAGTDPNSLLDPDWLANAGLATGAGSDQLVQASEYYLAIKAAYPDATITGHSLGGHGRHETGACLRRAA
ncbi:MAG: hypothetical protein AMXMBFR76_04890 [Pseudomonadota bacterium]|jgi:hypothetical protein